MVIKYFQEKHPTKLGNSLSITINTDILAHDVLDGFDYVADRHSLSNLMVQFGLKFVDGPFEVGAGAELLDELFRGTQGVERCES